MMPDFAITKRRCKVLVRRCVESVQNIKKEQLYIQGYHNMFINCTAVDDYDVIPVKKRIKTK
jgi:hypothetical protein